MYSHVHTGNYEMFLLSEDIGTEGGYLVHDELLENPNGVFDTIIEEALSEDNEEILGIQYSPQESPAAEDSAKSNDSQLRLNGSTVTAGL